MKRAKNDYDVTAPNGETFVVGWAPPRQVERTFGTGQWGVQVMRREGRVTMPVVEMRQVASECEGTAAIRSLTAAIEAGEWKPPAHVAKGGRRLTELPRWARPLLALVLGFVGFVGLGSTVVAAAVGAAG